MKGGAGGRAGFSLVELLIAITVLAVGLLSVANMQTVAISSGAFSQKLMVASELANEAMEDILAWDPAHPSLNATLSDIPYATNVSLAGGGTFTITYSTRINTPSFGTTSIVVTVTEVGNPLRSITPVVLSGYRRVV
jgi:type IV pilus assembly protein PilV